MSYLIPQQDILDAYAQTGRRNLSGLGQADAAQAGALIDEITLMLDETSTMSSQISRLIDSVKPGLATQSFEQKTISALFFNMKERANALFEKANAARDSWYNIYDPNADDFTTTTYLADIQKHHAEIKGVYDESKKFLTEADAASKDPVGYAKKFQTPGLFGGLFGTLLIVGGVGLAYMYIKKRKS